MTKTKLMAALGAAALLAASQAQAHARLVKADPGDKASVAAPAAVHLQFSEKLEPKLSGADLMKADGNSLASTAAVVGKTVKVTPKAPLVPGGYMVMWYAVSDDGHRTQGEYNFTVK